jgi:hypothetical protein
MDVADDGPISIDQAVFLTLHLTLPVCSQSEIKHVFVPLSKVSSSAIDKTRYGVVDSDSDCDGRNSISS